MKARVIMRKLGYLCLIVSILLFLTLVLDFQDFGILTYLLGFILIILSVFFFNKADKLKDER